MVVPLLATPYRCPMSSTRPSPFNRVVEAIVPRSVDALDPDELMNQIDLAALLTQREAATSGWVA